MKNKIVFLVLTIIFSMIFYNFLSFNNIYPVFNYNISLSGIYFNEYQRNSWITLGDSITIPNKYQSKLEDYVSTIKDLCRMYSLHVLDLYPKSGIAKEIMDTFTKDMLHPNDMGYERICEKMYRFLLNI